MTNQLIAVIDDEPDILELVSIHLKKANFRVREFTEAEPFYQFLAREIPDLIILDLMLPDIDGLQICNYLRGNDRFASIPIVMLTAKTEEIDKIIGLELGADDYVPKPFSPRELVARVRAVLRRPARIDAAAQRIVVSDVVIDVDRREVRVKGKTIDLTPSEFKILHLLAMRQGRIQTRDQILNFLWGDEKFVIDRTVDVHIRHLREKLGEASQIIKNVRGAGYRIDDETVDIP
ncbi:MAG: alkaline phosphatase synthesis transcriptional regulatory proteinphoP [Deltaproteobacteria bacterium]|nr:alkaline phosphatase synthesis transcriptional regulatory proteinphoP [Deltaproteobacteria bacterium]